MYCNQENANEASSLLSQWLTSEQESTKKSNKCQNGTEFFPIARYTLPQKATDSRTCAENAPALAAWGRELAKRLDITYLHTTNSGAAADLLALSALTAPVLGERSLRPGDEVITVALNATPLLAPILQLGAVPVAADVSPDGYNINVAHLEHALSPATRAVMISHTAGYPFDLKTVRNFCNDYELWLIEDCREALGATYDFDGTCYAAGTVGDIGCGALATDSGEIGFVCTRDDTLTLILQGLRDGIRADGDLCPSVDLGIDFGCNAAQISHAAEALQTLDAQLEGRKKSANGIEKALSHLLKFPTPLPNTTPAPSALPVLLEDAEACEGLAAALDAADVPYRHFQNAFSAPVWAHFFHRIPKALTETDDIAARALLLPLPRNEAALTMLIEAVREALA